MFVNFSFKSTRLHELLFDICFLAFLFCFAVRTLPEFNFTDGYLYITCLIVVTSWFLGRTVFQSFVNKMYCGMINKFGKLKGWLIWISIIILLVYLLSLFF